MDSKRSFVRVVIPFCIIHLFLTFGVIVALIQVHLSNNARFEKLEANCDCNPAKRDEQAQSFKEGNEREQSTPSLQVRRATTLDEDQRASEFISNIPKAVNSTLGLDIEKIQGERNATLQNTDEHVTNQTKLNEYNHTEINENKLENITSKAKENHRLSSGPEGKVNSESAWTWINTTDTSEDGNQMNFNASVEVEKTASPNKENSSVTENVSKTIFERQTKVNANPNRSNQLGQGNHSMHAANVSVGVNPSKEEKTKEGNLTGSRAEVKLKYLKRNVDLMLCLDELKDILEDYRASGSPLMTSQGSKGCKLLKGERGEKGCAGTSFAAPSFQRGPQSVIYDERDTAVLTCVAVANPTVKITWYRDETQIINEPDRYRIENRDVTPQASSRAKYCPSEVPHPVIQSTLMIKNTNGSDTGTYTCKAINILGAARFEIHALIRVFVKFIQIPSNITIVQGENAKLSCRASGIPQPNITWYRKDGGPVPSQYNTTEGDLYIVNIKKEEEGAFVCKATNVLGYETTEAAVTVNVFPKITSFLNHPIIVNESTSLILPCSATGYPIPDIRWVKSTGSLPKDRYYHDYRLLNITDVVYEDRGEYVCFANNTVGLVNRSIEVLVQVSPKIIKKPKKLEIGYLSSTKRLNFEVFSIPEAFMLWKRPSWTHQDDGRFTVENGSLVIHNVTNTDVGSYEVVATNLLGEARASTFLVVRKPVVPWIRLVPFATKVALNASAPIVKECTAFGQPPPIIVWKFKDRSLLSTTRSSLTLKITSTSPSQSGRYTCEASNVFGTASQDFEAIFVEVDVQNSCGHTRIDRNSGYIRSPGYPGSYSSGTSCYWKLTSDFRVRLSVDDFASGSNGNVRIYDGGSTSSRQIGTYSGYYSRRSPPKSISSSSRMLYVKFYSPSVYGRYYRSYGGFSIKYQGII